MTRTLLWVLASVVLLSFLEYFIHRAFMHRRSLPAWLSRRLDWLRQYHHAHAVLHHSTYFRRFNYEPDPVGQETDLRLGLATGVRLYAAASPLILGLSLIAPSGALVFSVAAGAHMYLWGLLHREMHIPRSQLLQRLAFYRLLARHHFLHHRYPGCNYNVVFPLADVVFGTVARAKACDLREMLRLGYLRAHRPKTLDRLARRTEHVALPASSK